MKYWGPINSLGGINGNDPYLNGDPIAGTHGSIPTFQIFEQTLRELTNLVIKSGLTPDAIIDGIQVAQAVQAGKITYATDTGVANAYAIALDPIPAGYTVGMQVKVKIAHTNTGNSTINVNGRGIVTILRNDGSPLKPGDLLTGQVATLVHDGTYFQLLVLSTVSRQQVQRQDFAVSGTFTPPPGVTQIFAQCWGAGGGSGGAGNANPSASAGAGGGGYSEGTFAVTPGVGVPITVGVGGIAGGGGGVSPQSGGAGGTSSVGAFCSATGGAGSGGIQGVTSIGSAAGSGLGGALNLTGQGGGIPYSFGTATYASGIGGAGGFNGASSQPAVPGVGIAGVFPGGGATGASSTITGGADGSHGANGFVIITW